MVVLAHFPNGVIKEVSYSTFDLYIGFVYYSDFARINNVHLTSVPAIELIEMSEDKREVWFEYMTKG